MFAAAGAGEGLLALAFAAAGAEGVVEIGGTAWAADAFLVFGRIHVLGLDRPAAAEAHAALAFLQPVRHGHAMVEYKAFAFPKAVVRDGFL